MPRLLVAPAQEQSPEKRMVLVLKWFLSTLKQQYASRNEKLGSEKKPLNPFLGELHLGKWEDDAGTTELVSEQVSHHPPVTAYSIWNDKHRVRLQGYNAQKASFGRTVNVRQVGHAMLHLDGLDEDYLITLPSLHTVGLITGSPYIELNGSNYIVSSTGYTARIDYSGKGYFSGKQNSFTAVVYPHGKENSKSDLLYTAEGVWTDSFIIKDSGKNEVLTYKAKDEPKTDLQVPPIEQQDPLESRRAWQNVAEAIKKGDMEKTHQEKTVIEEQQRAVRRKEKEEGKEWQTIFFSRAEKLPEFDKLIGEVPGASLESDQTNGIWVWDQEKGSKAERPYTELSRELEEKGWKGWGG